ncbi:oocyte zinc finger protein XlCOF7.1 isoform X2 [Bombina bombina]|uniref:oocyte zinc finger protein XlCOF7.1 isoform X2 n=1 Tax=Bombina bombina TaxID=8345 RepID=UPI00235A7344|nr:oocyte zinc finger protein XlCOF7.1 isoform X2 [Bombina bombina]
MINKMEQMTDRILKHALEIIYLLTGEEYTVVKKKKSRPRGTDLLTQEVPIKCDDFAVYFSVEEWEYIEGHKEYYKDVMKETRQTPETLEMSADMRLGACNTECASDEENIDQMSARVDLDAEEQEKLENDANDDKHCSVTVNETTEGDRHEKDFQHTDVCLDPCTETKNEIIESSEKIEETNVWRQIETLEQEIQENTSAGAHDKPLYYVSDDEEPEDERRDTDIYQITMPTDAYEGLHDRELYCVSDNGENERSRQHKDIEEREDNSDPCADQWMGIDMSGAYDQSSRPENLVCEEGANHVNRKAPCDTYMGLMTEGLIPNKDVALMEPHLYTHAQSKIMQYPVRLFKKYIKENSSASKTHSNDYNRNNVKRGGNSNPTRFTRKPISTGSKPFVCIECGKCFTLKSRFDLHQCADTGEKRFACFECGKCFKQKSHLITHRRIHTGEKPYACLVCGNCFSDRASFVRHQRIHTGEKPYVCNDCGKHFRQKTHLISHQRVHSGERQFACSYCRNCFNDRGSLARHQRIHLG